MNERLTKLLADVAAGRLEPARAAAELQAQMETPLGFAVLDEHRAFRQGCAEVVLGERKTAAQIVGIVQALRARGNPVLVTRVDPEKAAAVIAATPMTYHAEARALTGNEDRVARLAAEVAVVSAGTSDAPVAEECALTASMLGLTVARHYDIGVAGLHRLVSRIPEIRRAGVAVVIAGMEGALPSVVGGLLSQPVVAVPTSVGYGAGVGGWAALFGMLSSCASGVTVVNIDNGFGAAFAAYRILQPHGTAS